MGIRLVVGKRKLRLRRLEAGPPEVARLVAGRRAVSSRGLEGEALCLCWAEEELPGVTVSPVGVSGKSWATVVDRGDGRVEAGEGAAVDGDIDMGIEVAGCICVGAAAKDSLGGAGIALLRRSGAC